MAHPLLPNCPVSSLRKVSKKEYIEDIEYQRRDSEKTIDNKYRAKKIPKIGERKGEKLSYIVDLHTTNVSTESKKQNKSCSDWTKV